MGVGCQFVDDLSLGLFSAITGDLDNNPSQAFAEGRQVGRDASTKVAAYETVIGLAELTSALASMGPTTGLAIAAVPETGGASLVWGAGVEVAETAVAVGGAVTAVHGTMVLAKVKGGSGAGNFKFPDAKEMARRLGVDQDIFHRVIKPSILGDKEIVEFAKKSGH
jgi:hypothetical protein